MPGRSVLSTHCTIREITIEIEREEWCAPGTTGLARDGGAHHRGATIFPSPARKEERRGGGASSMDDVAWDALGGHGEVRRQLPRIKVKKRRWAPLIIEKGFWYEEKKKGTLDLDHETFAWHSDSLLYTSDFVFLFYFCTSVVVRPRSFTYFVVVFGLVYFVY